MNPPAPSRVHWVHRASTGVACAAASGLAVLALAGWQFGLSGLASLVPGYTMMNPLTAVCLLLASLSLWIARTPASHRRLEWLARGSAAAVAGFGALKLFSLYSGDLPGPDLLLLRTRLLALPVPNRMAANTALACVCLGSGLLTLDVRARRGWRPAEPFLLGGLAIALMALVGYLYSASPIRGLMAVNTACALLLLSTAALLSRPDLGLCRLLLSPSPGGVMARRVLPPAFVVPLVFGWLRLAGQRAGLFGLEIGTALLALMIVASLVGLVWMTAKSLDSADRERRRVEESLQRILQRQNALLETNLIGVLSANTQGWITEANPAFLDMIGYQRDELPLRTEWITPPEWLGLNDVALQQIIARGVATPFEKEYMRKDGRRVPVLVGAAALPGTQGEIMAFVVDLSGKQRAELEMERMRMFLDSIIEHLPSMIFVKDAQDLRFVRFNRAGEELLGFSREELLGKNDYDFFSREEADAFTTKDRAVLATRQLIDIPEERIRTKHGVVRILHTKKVPLLDREGEPQYLLGISEDITDRKRAERERVALNEGLRRRTEELGAANKELEAFSYSVSHDLRAPLRHIDGFTDLLRRHASSALDDKACRYLDLISDSAKSMGALIDDLLVFSRMGRAEMQRTAIGLGQLVEQVRESLAQEAAGREIEWRIAPLPVIQGDPAMLRLALTNLLANAVKYTRTRPAARIEIGASETDTETTVFVRDNGVGFDMDYAQKLFGVFQRLHRQDEFEGTGIGLANVRRIIDRHGGRTWAEGRLGQGATFYFSLPRPQDEALDLKEAA